MTCGVYKIVNSVNGKMYIGQSVDILDRWRDHKQNSKTKDGHLYSAIRKYGLDNFTFSIICEVPESALDQYEISYIKYYETTDRTKGYNKQAGGANGKHCEETKKKISDGNRGKFVSIESKLRMSDAKKNMSDETKLKMSNAKKKQYLYKGNVYIGKQELADFLGIKYKTLANKMSAKQIDVTILSQSQKN